MSCIWYQIGRSGLNHCLVQPFYAGTWVAELLATNLALGATFTHILIWNYADIMGAWSWMSPSSLTLMYRNFNWRFWTDDGMRKQTDDGESDPHYREMLKVIIWYTQHTLLSSHQYDSTLTLQIVGTLWPSWFLLLLPLWLYTRLIQLCHGKYFAVLDSAMFNCCLPGGDSLYQSFWGRSLFFFWGLFLLWLEWFSSSNRLFR